jgi:hypothetical protein
VSWQATDRLTLTTDASLIRGDFNGFYFNGKPSPVSAFGLAQYAAYTVSDTVALKARAEVFRNDRAAFVAAYPGNRDYTNLESGFLHTAIAAPGPTTYGAITLGATFQP